MQAPARNPVPLPNKAAETQPPPALEPLTVGRSGSDFMIDVLKTLNFEYMAANPASSFRGLHESLINYGGNTNPEFLTCSHEEISVAMGHGYFKIENKPLCIFAHGAVGLQHATMALYNAWCDKVPVYMVIGNIADATMRRPGVEWNHTVQDAAAIVRDYVKWDDYPASLQHFAESSVRAYKIMMTPPHGSVVIVADATMQEDPIPEHAKLSIPKLPQVALPRGDAGAVAETARRLVMAEHPVIIADRYARTPTALEASRRARRGAAMRGDRHQRTAQHAVAPSAQPEQPGARQRRPGRLHPRPRDERLLEFAQLLQGRRPPDVPPHRQARCAGPSASARATSTSARTTRTSSASPTSISPSRPTPRRPCRSSSRRCGSSSTASRRRPMRRAARSSPPPIMPISSAPASTRPIGWDASPISTARLCAELYAQIKDDDWSLASPTAQVSYWPQRLWTMDKPYQFIGDGGGMGIGYAASASLGAALANRKHGRLTVALQPDGDLLMTIGVLWTAAHHKIPILWVMHNNRGYHQEVMHVQRMADRHMRGIDRAYIGTTLRDPFIDYAKIAEGMGITGIGPISDPSELGPALKKGIALVKAGEPVLVDVVTQGR